MFNPPWEGSHGPSCSTARLQFMYDVVSEILPAPTAHMLWGKLCWAYHLISAAQTLLKRILGRMSSAQNDIHRFINVEIIMSAEISTSAVRHS